MGDTLRVELAVFAEHRRQVAPTGVVWTSSNPAAATVDENGLVRVHARAFVRIIASVGGAADTTAINIVPPWMPEGYARIEGRVVNSDGSPAARVLLSVNCDGMTAFPESDRNGNFSLLVETLLGHPYLPDSRMAVCIARTDSRISGAPAASLFTAAFSRPGRPAAPSRVVLMHKARPANLVLAAPTQSLRLGESTTISTTQDGNATNAVVFRSLLPEVASVDSAGRVVAHAPGSALILAYARSDTTRIGWLDIRVSRP